MDGILIKKEKFFPSCLGFEDIIRRKRKILDGAKNGT